MMNLRADELHVDVLVFCLMKIFNFQNELQVTPDLLNTNLAGDDESFSRAALWLKSLRKATLCPSALGGILFVFPTGYMTSLIRSQSMIMFS